jgi:hypothetical protein
MRGVTIVSRLRNKAPLQSRVCTQESRTPWIRYWNPDRRLHSEPTLTKRVVRQQPCRRDGNRVCSGCHGRSKCCKMGMARLFHPEIKPTVRQRGVSELSAHGVRRRRVAGFEAVAQELARECAGPVSAGLRAATSSSDDSKPGHLLRRKSDE